MLQFDDTHFDLYKVCRVSKQVKVCILGYPYVGKTGLLLRYVKGSFNEKECLVTIFASFLSKNIEFGKYNLELQIWDTAGQEIYQSLTKNYYRGAEIVILVYDTTHWQSFEEFQVFVEELRKYEISNAVLALVGNKKDLDNLLQVSYENGNQYAKSIGAVFLETSAKTGYNVDLLFEQVIRKYVEKLDTQKNENNLIPMDIVDVRMVEKAKERKKGCCGK